MNNKLEVHTETYEVVDSKGTPRIYGSVSSVKIEDKWLVLRSSGNSIIATFSDWKSSSIMPNKSPIVMMTKEELKLRLDRGATSENL